MTCRFCHTPLEHVFIDLFNSPASNSFLTAEQLNEPETFYPLKVFTCPTCFLVQVDEYKKSDAIFDSDYVYFSSFSTSWLAHSKRYVEAMTERFGLNGQSLVVEVASNDGYLLQYFVEKQIPVLGIEPTANTAAAAIEKGVTTITRFFGTELASELRGQGTGADLLLGNNVLAHVPNIVDFVKGMSILLNPEGVVTMEFPHLLQLVENNQFDTIYHEHFSYLSFTTVSQIFAAQGLVMFDVDELPTHGGSLRIYAKHEADQSKSISPNVAAMIQKEAETGLTTMAYYEGFQQRALNVKLDLLDFLTKQKRAGKSVAAYGAAAKGNTLLNYCGVKSDLIDFVVDANPAKQNKFLPASHIPVVDEATLKARKPDFVLILPWNLRDEITKQLSYISEWGGQFVMPIPEVKVL
ncbi:methyltransferase domain-containing protein [Fibrella aquatica]|uniref:methyltransferase domain-containing protein n=1 Tax=Fibrella aquatica TaxID=3242487 RepID=UPI00351FAF45